MGMVGIHTPANNETIKLVKLQGKLVKMKV